MSSRLGQIHAQLRLREAKSTRAAIKHAPTTNSNKLEGLLSRNSRQNQYLYSEKGCGGNNGKVTNRNGGCSLTAHCFASKRKTQEQRVSLGRRQLLGPPSVTGLTQGEVSDMKLSTPAAHPSRASSAQCHDSDQSQSVPCRPLSILSSCKQSKSRSLILSTRSQSCPRRFSMILFSNQQPLAQR